MTKKRSKSLFVLFSIILVICLIACFVSFTYPLAIKGNYYFYSNFVENLKLGEDVSNSIRIVYETEDVSTNYNELRRSTMNDLKKIVTDEGFKDVTVAEYGERGISIQIGNILSEEDESRITSLIGKPISISFSTDEAKSDIFATGKDIKAVTAGSNPTQTGEMMYFTMVEFNDEIKDTVIEKGKDVIYINIGEQQLKWEYGADEGKIPISLTTFTSVLDAQTFANQIRTGMLDLLLTETSTEKISPSYGHLATLFLIIAMVMFVIGAFVFLIVKYREAGVITCFSLLFFIVIGLFFLQSIPLVHINLAGIIAMLLGFTIAVDGAIMILEGAKAHYQKGTQLYISFREAQKESLFKTLFLNAILLVTGFICLFMPVNSIRSFGWVALVLSVVSVFTNLVLMRLFIKMYLALNNENGKKCNFHKGGKNA